MAIRKIVVSVALGMLALSAIAAMVMNHKDYPSPAYPLYMAEPNEEGLVHAARVAVRQTSGRSPLGIAEPGTTLHIIPQLDQDPLVQRAFDTAFAERDIEVEWIGVWELMGMTEEEFRKQARDNLILGEEGWQELGVFRTEFQQYFPEEIQAEFPEAFTSQVIRSNLKEFMDSRPEIEYVFAGTGCGRCWARQAGEAHSDKFLGNWTYYTTSDLLMKAAEFPSDLWNFVEDRILEPVPHTDAGRITDPEGTDLSWTITREEAAQWSENSGSAGHIYMYPSPVQATFAEGSVISGASNHTGFYPTMSVYLDEHARPARIEGGARTGELFRMLVEHPDLSTAEWPSAPAPGSWYLMQDGMGTNPKYVRDYRALVEGSWNIANISERNRAGVIHFAYSQPKWGTEEERKAFAEQNNLPNDHTAHQHALFPTVEWKLRDSDEWLTVVEDGMIGAYDDPEVRALAAQYGDPDLVLRYEWIPAVPGVNVEGNLADYQSDPFAWVKQEWEQIQSGTYEHYVEDYSLQQR